MHGADASAPLEDVSSNPDASHHMLQVRAWLCLCVCMPVCVVRTASMEWDVQWAMMARRGGVRLVCRAPSGTCSAVHSSDPGGHVCLRGPGLQEAHTDALSGGRLAVLGPTSASHLDEQVRPAGFRVLKP